ncbi:Uncharacterised protein [Klebsiella pneumoniae]|uniref:Uncharacterized protein n=1 Tax=Klebsiella pneumoniae TaxID=573 RepID=A0A378F2U4_KLEPN|nr:Uncharacterised protein [Klebsiella pneumoniae]
MLNSGTCRRRKIWQEEPSANASSADAYLTGRSPEQGDRKNRISRATYLNYLWRSCSGELSEQNDLFRLTCALETAKDMHWNYRLLSDREWSGRNAVALSAGVNGIYLSRANLDVAFDEQRSTDKSVDSASDRERGGGNEAV